MYFYFYLPCVNETQITYIIYIYFLNISYIGTQLYFKMQCIFQQLI